MLIETSDQLRAIDDFKAPRGESRGAQMVSVHFFASGTSSNRLAISLGQEKLN